MKRSVLIADDEPNAREYLLRILSSRNDLEILGGLKNGQEVIDFCKTLSPDIVILDIEMPGINGMQTAKYISKHYPSTVIVFITAFDQYAIDAFEYATIGYLLKPFGQTDLNRVLERAISQLNMIEKANFSDHMNSLWDKLERRDNKHITYFEIKEKGFIHSIEVSDILFIQSASEYVQLITSKKSFLQRLSIKMLADQLPSTFHRIHRTYIINEKYVSSWRYLSDGRFQFKMTNDQSIASSRSYKAKISEWIHSWTPEPN